jgi:crotonobetainyl-CoA:carnitine CoA-transferase CaiB-like acyl-CoA transferase
VSASGLPAGVTGALHGLRVLDLTHFHAGPYASMILGDMGADVVKVEPLQGDPMRVLGDSFVGGESVMFLSVNRNKRSIALDLKHPRGAELGLALATSADIVLHNFRPGVDERLGLDYASVRARNPKVVYCAVSAFGETGPYAARPAVDPIVQAMSGLMSITGEPDGPPTQLGASLSDTAGSMMAVRGVLLALLARERFGVGQKVTASMLDGSLSMLVGREGSYFATGRPPGRAGSVIRHSAPSGVYPTSDGHVMIAVMSDAFWQHFCAAVELEDLAGDERFSVNDRRRDRREELDGIIGPVLARASTSYWLDRFADHDVPAGPVNDLHAALTDPQTAANDMVVSMAHPTAGAIRGIGIPVKMSETPGTIRRPPPLLGEHTRVVLEELGVKPADVAELLAERVVVETAP